MRIVMQLGGFALASAIALFGSAGTLRWWNAWVFIGVGLLLIGSLTSALFLRNPELLEERQTARSKAKGWDRFFVTALAVLPFALYCIAGLDHREGWTAGVATWISLAALIPLLGGIGLSYWAMRSNPFFSSHVRIQSDRGHTVVSSGPYAFLRHPGYAGAIVYNLAAPLLLGSLAALGVGALIVVLLAIRTRLEDRTLKDELTGYGEYAERVRYRLIPRVW